MKKIIALVLALTLALCLCACGGSKAPASRTDVPKADTPKTEAPKTEAPKTEAPKTEAPTTETPAAPAEVKWPNGELTIYSGYAVGSLTDVNLHTIADWITKETGETVKIESNDTAGGATLALKLTQAKPDGQTIMAIGMNCISNYYNGTWEVNPADSSKFKICAGSIQPYPDSGCIILTQADSPYSSWQELAKYAEEHPGEVTVASIAGKVMDIKMKAIFNGTGVAKDIRWAPTKSADSEAALLGGNINCVMLDETTAASKYLKDGLVKPIINCRADEDFSYYTAEQQDTIVSVIKDIDTLADVFGADAAKYMVPNRSMFVAPADTPDDICAAIAKVIDKIDEEPSTSEFYERCRVNGGTSKYYTWPGDEVMAEWARLDPIIKEIVEMG